MTYLPSYYGRGLAVVGGWCLWCNSALDMAQGSFKNCQKIGFSRQWEKMKILNQFDSKFGVSVFLKTIFALYVVKIISISASQTSLTRNEPSYKLNGPL